MPCPKACQAQTSTDETGELSGRPSLRLASQETLAVLAVSGVILTSLSTKDEHPSSICLTRDDPKLTFAGYLPYLVMDRS